MSNKKTTPERLAAFSDGVFAVIITIMVLDLKPPNGTTLRALVPLWPTALSYAVSYFFIAIIWVNHHHLLRFTHSATPQLIWWNFAHLLWFHSCRQPPFGWRRRDLPLHLSLCMPWFLS
jgi:uncharacterized membrane protein